MMLFVNGTSHELRHEQVLRVPAGRPSKSAVDQEPSLAIEAA